MKHLLIGCGSQYIHVNLAVWYLRASCAVQSIPVTVLETTVNQPLHAQLLRVLEEAPDTVAFSCYLWNIETVLRLSKDIKTILPHVKIVLGGPEVSFDAPALRKSHPHIDYILCGEGETAYPALLKRIESAALPSGACDTDDWAVSDLDTLPSPYTEEMLDSARGRIVYYESSRGCPFRCAYCLSPACGPVRTFSLERVEQDLRTLAGAGVSLIKFVDRTFNWNRNRALSILNLLKKLPDGIRYHFEIGGDLLDEALVSALLSFPAGTFQLEMGVQSTHPATLTEICRSENTAEIFAHAKTIMTSEKIHLHMDLIAGLPYEGLAEFERSFNEVYACRPHTLQLGFLKLLKGSALHRDADEYGIRYRDYPPYEVLETPWLPAQALLSLGHTEDVLDRMYNSGRFTRTVRHLERFFPSPFEMYHTLGCALQKHSASRPVSALELYTLVYNTACKLDGVDSALLCDLLRCDQYAAAVTGKIPGIPEEDAEVKKAMIRAFLDDEQALFAHFPHLSGLSRRERNGRLRFMLSMHNPGSGEKMPRPALIAFDPLCKNSVNGLLPNILIKS